MKRPYLNQEERNILKLDCLQAEFIKLDLAIKKIVREIRVSNGYFAARKAERALIKAINNSITYRGWPEKRGVKRTICKIFKIG